MNNKNYNGWSNWSTRNTFNWITNDYFTENHFREIENYNFFVEEVKGFIKTIKDPINSNKVNFKEIWNGLKE